MNGNGFFIILLAFGVMWLVLIRPQRARQQRQQQALNAVAPGDEVLTVGGLYGIVQSIDDEGDLIVEIAEGIHVRVARRSVATVVKPDDDDGLEEEHEHNNGKPVAELPSGESAVTVPDDQASLEATQKRLFGRRN